MCSAMRRCWSGLSGRLRQGSDKTFMGAQALRSVTLATEKAFKQNCLLLFNVFILELCWYALMHYMCCVDEGMSSLLLVMGSWTMW